LLLQNYVNSGFVGIFHNMVYGWLVFMVVVLVLWLHQSTQLPNSLPQLLRLRRRMNPAKLFPFKGMRQGAGARDEASCMDWFFVVVSS
jgi:hypothetical protein